MIRWRWWPISLVMGALFASPAQSQESRYSIAEQQLRQAASANEIDEMREFVRAAAESLTKKSFLTAALNELLDSLSDGERAAGSIDQLHAELIRIADDLAFRPRMEAEFPAGFPPFTVVGEVEVKQYPAYRMVRTDMDANPQTGRGNAAFFRLFSHIQQNKIAMTTPVEMEYQEDGKQLRETSMAFLYGSPEIGQTGDQAGAEVVDVPALTVVSTGVRGKPSEQKIRRGQQRLRAWLRLNADKFAAEGKLRVMGYNSPFVPESDAYFEVQYAIRPAK